MRLSAVVIEDITAGPSETSRNSKVFSGSIFMKIHVETFMVENTIFIEYLVQPPFFNWIWSMCYDNDGILCLIVSIIDESAFSVSVPAIYLAIAHIVVVLFQAIVSGFYWAHGKLCRCFPIYLPDIWGCAEYLFRFGINLLMKKICK